jgi:hypothetical protein
METLESENVTMLKYTISIIDAILNDQLISIYCTSENAVAPLERSPAQGLACEFGREGVREKQETVRRSLTDWPARMNHRCLLGCQRLHRPYQTQYYVHFVLLIRYTVPSLARALGPELG